MLLESHLHNLVAQVDEGDASGVVAAVHHHQDSFSELLVVVEEMDGVGVVIHSFFCFGIWCKDRDYFETCNNLALLRTLFYTFINMSYRFLYFCQQIQETMNSETLTLMIVWGIAVVAFFVLWAILAKVVQRIGKKKKDAAQKDETVQDDTQPTETTHERDD